MIMLESIVKYKEEYEINRDLAVDGFIHSDIELLKESFGAINDIFSDMVKEGLLHHANIFQDDMKKSFSILKNQFQDKRKKGLISLEALGIITHQLGVDLFNEWFSGDGISGTKVVLTKEEQCIGLKQRLFEDYSHPPMPVRSNFGKYYYSGNYEAICLLINHFSKFENSGELFERYELLQSFSHLVGTEREINNSECNNRIGVALLENKVKIEAALNESHNNNTFTSIPLWFMEMLSRIGFSNSIVKLMKENLDFSSFRKIERVNKKPGEVIIESLYSRLCAIGLENEVRAEVFTDMVESSAQWNFNDRGVLQRLAYAIEYVLDSGNIDQDLAKKLVGLYFQSTVGRIESLHALYVMQAIVNVAARHAPDQPGNLEKIALAVLDGLEKPISLHFALCKEKLEECPVSKDWMKKSSLMRKLEISSDFGL